MQILDVRSHVTQELQEIIIIKITMTILTITIRMFIMVI